MYYDRRLPPALLDLLLPDAPLGWLLPWLHTAAAEAVGAHVQTRRARGDSGRIQLYLGRTSPLIVQGRAGGRVRLHAHGFYRRMSPALFRETVEPAQLGALSGAIREHVERAAEQTHRSFLDGEAVLHAGLMRRYGPLASGDVPFVAVDSEAHMGFPTAAARSAFEARLPSLVGLPPGEEVPRKLDLVGLDRAGRVLLVEVKLDATGLQRAGWQAAVHVARFRALLGEEPGWCGSVLAEVVREKARVGLFGRARPAAVDEPALVPVIAARDDRDDWSARWRTQLAPVLRDSRRMLDGLRLWRLDAAGRVVGDVPA